MKTNRLPNLIEMLSLFRETDSSSSLFFPLSPELDGCPLPESGLDQSLPRSGIYVTLTTLKGKAFFCSANTSQKVSVLITVFRLLHIKLLDFFFFLQNTTFVGAARIFK